MEGLTDVDDELALLWYEVELGLDVAVNTFTGLSAYGDDGGIGSLYFFLNGILAIAGAASSATARRETPFFDGYAMIGLVINIAVIVITFGLFLIGAAL